MSDWWDAGDGMGMGVRAVRPGWAGRPFLRGPLRSVSREGTEFVCWSKSWVMTRETLAWCLLLTKCFSQTPPAVNLTQWCGFWVSAGFLGSVCVPSSRSPGTVGGDLALTGKVGICLSVFFDIKWLHRTQALDFGRQSSKGHILCSVFSVNFLMLVRACSGEFGLCTSRSPLYN